MNKQLLREKLQKIGQANEEVDAELLNRFGNAVESLGIWERLRINPLAFAEKHGFVGEELIPLFLYGVKAGVFELNWNMLCPLCGGVEHSVDSLNLLEMDQFHCTLCDVDVQTELDSIIEVSFQLDPSVAKTTVDPFENQRSYLRYYFSENFVLSPEMIAYIERSRATFVRVPAKGSAEHLIHLNPGEDLRLVSFDKHLELDLITGTEQAADGLVVEATLEPGQASASLDVPHGTFTLRLHNAYQTVAGMLVFVTNRDSDECLPVLQERTFRPFLSGKMLLNNQTFRTSFLIENVPNDLNLRLNDLTVLFTDLKGSTELYEKTGDIHAYKLVQEHFRILTEVVARHNGATVKTMGDALMASFSSPRDGVLAALEMISRMCSLHAEIGLKIGLHSGPALAVKANETVDFFGQTVNTAAHVQSKASAGQIWLTDRVLEADGVQEALREGAYTEKQHTVLLKGAQKESVVYCCSPA